MMSMSGFAARNVTAEVRQLRLNFPKQTSRISNKKLRSICLDYPDISGALSYFKDTSAKRQTLRCNMQLSVQNKPARKSGPNRNHASNRRQNADIATSKQTVMRSNELATPARTMTLPNGMILAIPDWYVPSC